MLHQLLKLVSCSESLMKMEMMSWMMKKDCCFTRVEQCVTMSLIIMLQLQSVKKWDFLAHKNGKVDTILTYRITWTSNWMMCDALIIMCGHLVVTMNLTTVTIARMSS